MNGELASLRLILYVAAAEEEKSRLSPMIPVCLCCTVLELDCLMFTLVRIPSYRPARSNFLMRHPFDRWTTTMTLRSPKSPRRSDPIPRKLRRSSSNHLTRTRNSYSVSVFIDVVLKIVDLLCLRMRIEIQFTMDSNR